MVQRQADKAQNPFLLFDPTQSKRDKELSSSLAKAHAAKVSSRKATKGFEKVSIRHILPANGNRPSSARVLSAVCPASNSKQTSSFSQSHSDSSVQATQPEQEALVAIAAPLRFGSLSRNPLADFLPDCNDGSAPRAIEYLTQYVVRTTTAADHAFCVTSFWKPIVTAMLRFRDLFHALCAMFAAACATLHDSDTGIMKTVLYHRLKAIRILRARLLQANASADDGALLTIIMLSVVDKHSRDEDAFQIHQQQVEIMIRVRGGISALDSQYGVRAFLRQGRALSVPELNNFTEDDSVPNNAPTSGIAKQPPYIPSPDIMALIPTGFHPLIVVQPALLSLDTTRCVMRIAATQSCSLQVPNGTYTNSTLLRAASQIPADDAEQSGPSAFESYSDACPALNSPTASLFEKLLCFALVRCVVNRVSLYRTWMCPYEEIALTLTNKLPRTPVPALDTATTKPSSSAAQREALLWIWLTTIDAWSIGLPGARMRPQGRDLLKQLYERFTETHSWSGSDWQLWSKRWFVRREVWAWFEHEWPTIVMEATLEKLTGEERSEVKGKKVCEELLDEFMDGNLVAGGAFVGDERTRAFEGLTRGLSN